MSSFTEGLKGRGRLYSGLSVRRGREVAKGGVTVSLKSHGKPRKLLETSAITKRNTNLQGKRRAKKQEGRHVGSVEKAFRMPGLKAS